MTFTPAVPFLASFNDRHGRSWLFAYWGAEFVFIREVADTHATSAVGNPSRDAWPYVIPLKPYGIHPGDVTMTWLTHRAAEWITDRNNENKEDTP